MLAGRVEVSAHKYCQCQHADVHYYTEPGAACSPGGLNVGTDDDQAKIEDDQTDANAKEKGDPFAEEGNAVIAPVFTLPTLGKA